MASDLDRARSVYSLDRTGFRQILTRQAVGRALAHAALLRVDGGLVMSAETNADFALPQPPPVRSAMLQTAGRS